MRALRAECLQTWAEDGEAGAGSREAREMRGRQGEGFAYQTSLFLIITIMEIDYPIFFPLFPQPWGWAVTPPWSCCLSDTLTFSLSFQLTTLDLVNN